MKKSSLSERARRIKLFRTAGTWAAILLGNALFALAVTLFIMPSGLVTGGATGLSIMISHYTGIGVSYLVMLLNVLLFIVGTVFLGRHFAVTTAASTVLYPVYLNIFERIFGGRVMIEDDLILNAACAGLLIGIALGLVVRVGSSTGGMDIPPLILHKYTGLPVGTGMLIFDASIIGAQLVYATLRQTLYGIIMVIIYSALMEQVITMGNSKIQISVISRQSESLREAVMKELDRGVTMLSARKGYTGESCEMVLTVVSGRQLARAKKLILDCDPEAFMIINRISEVNGNGFSFFRK